MNLLSKSIFCSGIDRNRLHACARWRVATWGACLVALVGSTQAATPLADLPIFASSNVPGNLALVLSTEFPTVVGAAYARTPYDVTKDYLGYFDPARCYVYTYTNGTDVNNYFSPSSAATAHVCSGKWSGNFLNWAATQTIDPFRWTLTGGYRVIDTTTTTVVEKGHHSGQGGTYNYPDPSITDGALIAGATPFPATTTALNMRIQGLGNKMRFTVPGVATVPVALASFTGKYYNNQTRSGGAVLTRPAEPTIFYNWNSVVPGPGVNRENMSVRWDGSIKAPTAGTYEFRVRADDTVQLRIQKGGGALTQVVNQTSYAGMVDQVVAPYTGVAANTVFTIQLDFSQGPGASEIYLEWKTPGSADWVPVGGSAPNTVSVNAASPTPTQYNGIATAGGVVYEAFVRAKVCASSALKEANCVAYGTNFKPEGLMQKYANKIRYSAFGYLNDSRNTDPGAIERDGGVLRARQKFIGPTQPVPGSSDVTNAKAPTGPAGQVTGGEWSAVDGTMTINPDKYDADNTSAVMGLPASAIANSGVLNYLNKFGQITPGNYKSYDSVSELYYAAIRYFRNLSPVAAYSSVPGGTSNATKLAWADGFPVITEQVDPILYTCQSNFILGIGDTNTHSDKNVPGYTHVNGDKEPATPAEVTADTTWNAITSTNKVGVLQGLGASLGATYPWTGGNNFNSALMAGLAYDAHIRDIRGRTSLQIKEPQTIETYWVDVMESGEQANNQFYLAAKYGGFTVPTDYDVANTTPLSQASWASTADTLGGQPRPDNYFSGAQPDLMKAALDAAFADIAKKITKYTTSFSTSLPQVAVAGNSSFSSKYDAVNWTGEVTASELKFDTNNKPTLVEKWNFSAKLSTQLAEVGAVKGWDTDRRVVTWNGSAGVPFRAASLTADLANLNTSYVPGDDSANYINYLRGEAVNEVKLGSADANRVYRTREKLFGDVVGSKARPVGPPADPFSEAANPGYTAFRTTWKNRLTVVYVGANDGMLHAINGALVSSSTPATLTQAALEGDASFGQEMFAYVPRALIAGPSTPATPNVDGLASLGKPAGFSHHYMVNATPSVHDIDFGKAGGATGAPNWKSVLIGGLGKGGRSYYAIDVTDPKGMIAGATAAASELNVASKVLWEIKSSQIGFTFGEPVVTKTKKYGWTVIFPSGYNNADGKGYFVFVDPRNGNVLETISTTAGSVANDAGLAHVNAFEPDATDGTADALYAGDLLGNLWRLDITGTGTYPAPTLMATLTSPLPNDTVAQPLTSRPVIEVHPNTKKRFVLFGTGRLLEVSDAGTTAEQTFYAVADGTNAAFKPAAATPGSVAFPYTRSNLAKSANGLVGVEFNPVTQVGWYEDLGTDDQDVAADTSATPPVVARAKTGIAYRVTLDATTLAGKVAYATTLAIGTACSPSGTSRLYAKDFAKATTFLKTYKNGALVPAEFQAVSGSVTDLRFISVNGKGTLISGTDSGGVDKVETFPFEAVSLRRINWRELPEVQ